MRRWCIGWVPRDTRGREWPCGPRSTAAAPDAALCFREAPTGGLAACILKAGLTTHRIFQNLSKEQHIYLFFLLGVKREIMILSYGTL